MLAIENSRSGDAMLRALAEHGYGRDVGAGCYDVHSPMVPRVDGMLAKLTEAQRAGLAGGNARRLWAVPDCGLETRAWGEVLPALRNMVAAAQQARQQLQEGQ